MYQPASFTETRLDVLHAVMRAAPLASLVIHGPDGLDADPLPLLLDSAAGPHGTLAGHCARANPLWTRAGPDGIDALAIFHGPEHYVSPAWYPAKQEHGRVVPTWNYVVAHAHGVARAVEDRAWLLDMLHRLTEAHESSRPAPWSVGDAPTEFIDQMLGAIVGIEIPIDRLEGKCKASQDEAMPDRLGTVRGLREQPGAEAGAVADQVQAAITAEAAGRR